MQQGDVIETSFDRVVVADFLVPAVSLIDRIMQHGHFERHIARLTRADAV
jgi:hypothetical protein